MENEVFWILVAFAVFAGLCKWVTRKQGIVPSVEYIDIFRKK
jgi:hypothetical protein